MESVNFNDVKQSEETKLQHLLPDCHSVIVGSTDQGTTNLLLNMLLQLVIVVQYTLWMNNWGNILYFRISDLASPYFEMLRPEEVAPVEDIDDAQNKIIVFN